MWVELLCLFMKSVDFLKKLLSTLYLKKWLNIMGQVKMNLQIVLTKYRAISVKPKFEIR